MNDGHIKAGKVRDMFAENCKLRRELEELREKGAAFDRAFERHEEMLVEIAELNKKLKYFEAKEAEEKKLKTALARALETNKRLNRRAQKYEAAMKEKLEAALPERRTLGRALANGAAYMFMEENEELKAKIARMEDALRKGDLFHADDVLKSALAKAEAEVERLRGELKVAGCPCCDSYHFPAGNSEVERLIRNGDESHANWLAAKAKLEAVRDHCKNMRGTAHEFRKPIDAILDPLDEILAGRWQECHCEVCEEPAATEGGGDE